MDFRPEQPVCFTRAGDGATLLGVVRGPPAYSLRLRTLEDRLARLFFGDDFQDTTARYAAGSRTRLARSEPVAPGAVLSLDISKMMTPEMLAVSIGAGGGLSWAWDLREVPAVVESCALTFTVLGQRRPGEPPEASFDLSAALGGAGCELYRSVKSWRIVPREPPADAKPESPAGAEPESPAGAEPESPAGAEPEPPAGADPAQAGAAPEGA